MFRVSLVRCWGWEESEVGKEREREGERCENCDEEGGQFRKKVTKIIIRSYI